MFDFGDVQTSCRISKMLPISICCMFSILLTCKNRLRHSREWARQKNYKICEMLPMTSQRFHSWLRGTQPPRSTPTRWWRKISSATERHAFSKNAFFKKFANFWRARSRLYQNEILQENMRSTAFFKLRLLLYKICILLHRGNLKNFAKKSVWKISNFCENSEKNCKCRKICNFCQISNISAR